MVGFCRSGLVQFFLCSPGLYEQKVLQSKRHFTKSAKLRPVRKVRHLYHMVSGNAAVARRTGVEHGGDLHLDMSLDLIASLGGYAVVFRQQTDCLCSGNKLHPILTSASFTVSCQRSYRASLFTTLHITSFFSVFLPLLFIMCMRNFPDQL